MIVNFIRKLFFSCGAHVGRMWGSFRAHVGRMRGAGGRRLVLVSAMICRALEADFNRFYNRKKRRKKKKKKVEEKGGL